MLTLLEPFREEMAATAQDPVFHGEGDVWQHTRLVCRAMEGLPEYRQADSATAQLLSMAAALHDIGKISTTRWDGSHIIAPGHARLGAQMAREYLWLHRHLCGREDAQQLREGVCGLIRYHSLPLHAFDEPDGQLRLLRFAANGALAPGLTVKNLCALAQADVLGRQCPDAAALLERIGLCQELARELGCYDGPCPFPTDYTRYACLSGRAVSRDYALYDDTWGEVTMLSGLPGTGKDTWIARNCAALPMVSLDDIRRTMGISPEENQGPVVEAAREQAKKYLRSKQGFVWNATNLSPQLRARQAQLFADYGARVRMVYLETSWAEQLRRNAQRSHPVPQSVICRMLGILSPPEMGEAGCVQWLCV